MVSKQVAYMHIQKDMFSSEQTVEDTMAYLVKKSGPYYEVTKTLALGDGFTWSVHESNVLAIFDHTHLIWKYLYK